MPAETTARVPGKPFQVGQSGNPLGRPRGAKHRLTNAFISAIVDDFVQFGSEAISKLRAEDPATYLKLICSMIPRELILQREKYHDVDYASLSIDEFAELVEEERKRRFFQRAVEHEPI